MRKTTFLKTILLAAAMMLGGASLADAQTTLYYRTLTGTESDPADAAEQAWSATDKDGTSANSWTGDLSNASISNGLKLQGTSAKEIQYSYTYSPYYKLTYDIVWNIGHSSQDSYSNISKLKIGNVIEFNWGMRSVDRYGRVKINGTTYSLPNYYQSEDWIIHVEIDTYTNTLKALTVAGEKRTTTAGGTDYAAFSYNLNDITGSTEKSLTSTPSYSSIALGFGWGKGTLDTTLKSVKIQETSQNVFVYAVNYISTESGSPVTVKSVSSPDYLGEAIPVQRIITGDDSKEYIVTDVDLPSQTIADDSDDADINVINLNVRQRYKCSLIVKNSFDGVIDEDFTVVTPLEESEEFAHSWKYVFPLYKKKGDDYYKATLKSEKYGEEGTFEYDNITKTVEYTLAPFVCYVEDDGPGTNIDYSYGTSKTIYKTKVSLGAFTKGYYTLTGRMGNDGTTRTFYIYSKTGEVVSASLGSLSGKNRAISTQTIYLDNDVDELYLQNSGANTIYDYVVVERSHVAISAVDNLGYTFSSTLPLDFTDTDVRAYIAKYDEVNDVMRLTNVKKVLANTGVLIFSDSELTNQSIPVTAGSTDDATGNCLVAVSSAMTLSAAPDGYENYVLAIEDDKAVFQLVKTNSASMSAGQAYLQIPKRTSDARSLRIVFDDETTGVADVRSKMSDVRSDFYNLNGQHVEKPAKGLYIQNGKKVIVK